MVIVVAAGNAFFLFTEKEKKRAKKKCQQITPRKTFSFLTKRVEMVAT